MDLDEIKAKFKHKTSVDIKDLDYALKAVPFMIHEIERLEGQEKELENRLQHYSSLMKKRPPLVKRGKRGGSSWEVRVDETTNRLYLSFSGTFDYRCGKSFSNCLVTVLPNLREDFDVVNDISKISGDYDKRSIFHIKKISFNLNQAKARRVVRVENLEFPEISEVFDIQIANSKVQMNTVATVEEAESVLGNVVKFLKT